MAAVTEVQTMQAIVQDEYGEAAVLRQEEIARPVAGDDEVLVRVHAAGVDYGAWHLMTGRPNMIRLMGYGVRTPKTRVRGREFAGTVESVGKDVTQVRPGDKVYGIGEGCFAEYAVAGKDKVVPKPSGVTFEQAAAVPMSGLTALQAVRDRGNVQPGQKLLVIGASGGVGTFAVQIAKASGAEVTGVCRTSKIDLVRSLGADHVIDYTREDITRGQHRYDVVINIGGNRKLSHLRRALAPRGTLVIVGGETGGKWTGGFGRSLRAPVMSMFLSQTLRGLISSENADDLRELTELIDAGKVRPAVDRTYPLSETPAAIERLRAGQVRGKVVVTV